MCVFVSSSFFNEAASAVQSFQQMILMNRFFLVNHSIHGVQYNPIPEQMILISWLFLVNQKPYSLISVV